MVIKKIVLREILDSRGNITVEAEVSGENFKACAAAPSGASVGKYEKEAFPKGGAREGISAFNKKITDKLIGVEADYKKVDAIISESDPDFAHIGGNTSVAVSLAVGKLQAKEKGIEFHALFNGAPSLPFPLGNIIGGGVHSGKGSPELQEFLTLPVGAKSFKEAVLANSKVHKLVGQIIDKKLPNFTRGRNDEGAWAPPVTIEEAIAILNEAVDKAKSEFGFKIKTGVDLASSEFYSSKEKKYVYKNFSLSPSDQVNFVVELFDRYGFFYIEDPIQEEDFGGFANVTKEIGKKCLIVGDDLTVSSPERLETAVKQNSINSLIVKPNQIGSLTQTENVIKAAKRNKIIPVVSHRSGETTDTSIAHIAAGFKCPIIKTGAVGGERIAKLNELIRIEEKTKAKLAEITL
ncbi:TPA: phosphopyruvate hydratase [archaeon]|nr:phosphopyruvate hydratase [Candidatus Naiadarchaeales archaeon SRR2090159.bin1288]